MNLDLGTNKLTDVKNLSFGKKEKWKDEIGKKLDDDFHYHTFERDDYSEAINDFVKFEKEDFELALIHGQEVVLAEYKKFFNNKVDKNINKLQRDLQLSDIQEIFDLIKKLPDECFNLKDSFEEYFDLKQGIGKISSGKEISDETIEGISEVVAGYGWDNDIAEMERRVEPAGNFIKNCRNLGKRDKDDKKAMDLAGKILEFMNSNEIDRMPIFFEKYWLEELKIYYRNLKSLLSEFSSDDLGKLNDEEFLKNKLGDYYDICSHIQEEKINQEKCLIKDKLEKTLECTENGNVQSYLDEKNVFIDQKRKSLSGQVDCSLTNKWEKNYLKYLESEYRAIGVYNDKIWNQKIDELLIDIASVRADSAGRYVAPVEVYKGKIYYGGFTEEMKNMQKRIDCLNTEKEGSKEKKNSLVQFALLPVKKKEIIKTKKIVGDLQDQIKRFGESNECVTQRYQFLVDLSVGLGKELGEKNFDWISLFDNQSLTVDEYFERLTNYVKSKKKVINSGDLGVMAVYEKLLGSMGNRSRELYMEVATDLSEAVNNVGGSCGVDRNILKKISLVKYFDRGEEMNLAREASVKYITSFDDEFLGLYYRGDIEQKWWEDYKLFLESQHGAKKIVDKYNEINKEYNFWQKNQEKIGEFKTKLGKLEEKLEPVLDAKIVGGYSGNRYCDRVDLKMDVEIKKSRDKLDKNKIELDDKIRYCKTIEKKIIKSASDKSNLDAVEREIIELRLLDDKERENFENFWEKNERWKCLHSDFYKEIEELKSINRSLLSIIKDSDGFFYLPENITVDEALILVKKIISDWEQKAGEKLSAQELKIYNEYIAAEKNLELAKGHCVVITH